MSHYVQNKILEMLGTVNVTTTGVGTLVTEALNNNRFLTYPGSRSSHHAYIHGLITHTSDVINIGLNINRTVNCSKPANEEVFFIAALFHDYGKIREIDDVVFAEDGKLIQAIYTKNKYLLHHINMSTQMFHKMANKHQVDQDFIDKVTHCIIAHHGRPEWGSVIEPKTLEALLLHTADHISARFDDRMGMIE